MQHQQPDNYTNVPVRLTPKELNDPAIVLENFFQYYSLNDIRNHLEDWMIQAMSSDMPELQDWKTRNSLLYFRSQLELVMEANYMLLHRCLKASGKASSKSRRKRKKKGLAQD